MGPPSSHYILEMLQLQVFLSHNRALQTASPQVAAEEANLTHPYGTTIEQFRGDISDIIHRELTVCPVNMRPNSSVSQDIYGMLVNNCTVRDGLGWGEELLINEQG